MKKHLAYFVSDILHLFYPHHCTGCGSDIVYNEQLLCAKCIHRLPHTGFFDKAANPVEKVFYGRVHAEAAAAAFYFTKQSLVQHLLVQLKYKGNREAGYFLGRQMGYLLSASARFTGVDYIIPLPLNRKKEQLRGYNQAALISEGIADTWQKPMLSSVVERTRFTETQTQQNRISRWQNMEQVFAVTDAAKIAGKHILLVDDVVTTGATLEACAAKLLAVSGTRVSIAAAAYTLSL